MKESSIISIISGVNSIVKLLNLNVVGNQIFADPVVSFLRAGTHDGEAAESAFLDFGNLASENIEVHAVAGRAGGDHRLRRLFADEGDAQRLIAIVRVSLENVADVLHDLKTIVSGQIYAKQLELYMDAMDVTDEDVYCDKTRLNQILLNLLSNAIKFTPAGGTIRFGVEKLGPEAEISIWNSGQGISPEALPYVFQRFYKEDRSRGLHARGAGLGLNICKVLVNLGELPPAGQWANFPCCVGVASEEMIAKNPEVVRAFVALISRVGAWCNAHPQQAGEIAAQWIGLPPEAGRKSSLVFLGNFNDSWLRGADTYLRILDSMNKFSGSLRHKTMEQARPLLIDDSFLDTGK